MKSKEVELIEEKAEQLIKYAESLDLIVTISLKPLEPLAMGNHKMVAEVSPRKPY
jgi:hypothetical protein